MTECMGVDKIMVSLSLCVRLKIESIMRAGIPNERVYGMEKCSNI